MWCKKLKSNEQRSRDRPNYVQPIVLEPSPTSQPVTTILMPTEVIPRSTATNNEIDFLINNRSSSPRRSPQPSAPPPMIVDDLPPSYEEASRNLAPQILRK